MIVWEAKDPTKLLLNELICSLISQKITIYNQEQKENPKKNLTFKIVHHIKNNYECIVEDISLIKKHSKSLIRKEKVIKDF